MNSSLMFDWNDLRHFLAVARAGSTLGAARELRTSQPTVVRRLAALEAAAGVDLFERGPGGCVLTEAGRDVVPLAEKVEAEVQALCDALDARKPVQPGVIRLTSPELLTDFLFPMLRSFGDRYPQVQLQMLQSDRRFDLRRGEADVAVRPGPETDPEGLHVRRLPDVGWTVYGSRTYAAARGLPSTPAELDLHSVVGSDGYLDRLTAWSWLRRAAPNAPVVWRCNLMANVRQAVRSGLGLAPLPCLSAYADPELVPCFPPPSELDHPLWLLARRELVRMPYVRAFLDAAATYCEAHRDLFSGHVLRSQD